MPDSNITKRALAQAMKGLMQRKPFVKISVSDICDACGMNRKSFYYHFRDKYDLVNWIFYTEFVEAMQENLGRDGWVHLAEMCRYFHQNRVFYVNALKVTGQDSFREYFSLILTPILFASMEEAFVDSKHQAFYAGFFTDALLIAIERWLNEDTLGPDEFLHLLRMGIEGAARRLMDRLEHEKTQEDH